MTKNDWGYLFGMALQTVPEPRKVARDIFAFPAPRRALWHILALLLVAMTFIAVLSSILFPVDPEELGALLGDEAMTPAFVSPIVTGLAQATTAVLTVWAIYGFGRAFGGTGSFDQALLTVIWLHFVLLILQLGILLLGLFAPGLSLLLTLLSFVMTFWLLSHFVAEMHGFRSAGSVFAGIMMVLLVLAVALSLLMALLGFGMPVTTAAGGA
ncbi:MAG: YIP1 family protein [Maritimibacter sp.]|nr:YIP1 family protein [Maritimibacter sp.]